MGNPIRSEAEAYRFLLITIGVAAAVVAASLLGGPWAGTAAAAVLIGLVVWLYVRPPRSKP